MPVTFDYVDGYERALHKASQDSASAFMARNRARARTRIFANIEECWAAYDSQPKNRKFFTVTRDEFERHWELSNDVFRSFSPTQCLIDAATFLPTIGVIPHPGVLTFASGLAFGTGQLSVWHFRKVSKRVVDSWNDELRLSTTLFPAKLSPPADGTFSTLLELKLAVENLHKYSAYLGSPCFHAFSTALYVDIQQCREPPHHISAFKCFEATGHRYGDLLLQLQVHRNGIERATIKAELRQELGLGTNNYPARTQVQGGTTPRFSANPVHPAAAPMPPAIEALIPKQSGIPCCLKNLTVKGCTSRLMGNKCGNGSWKKAHFEPKLPESVKTWMRTRWGPLKSE